MAEHGSTNPLVTEGFKYKEEYKYDKKRIPIGEIWNGEVHYLRVKKTFRGLIIASSGDGKTFLGNGIRDAFLAAEDTNKAMIISDVKNEYHTMWKPAQAKYARYLMKTISPQGYPCKVFYPKFLDNKIPFNQQKVQYKLKELTASDISKFAGGSEITLATLNVLEKTLKKLRRDPQVTVEKVKRVVNSIQLAQQSSKNKVIGILEILFHNSLIGNRYESPNFTTVLNAGKVPILNTFGLDMGFSREYENYLFTMMGKIMDDVWTDKMTKKLKKCHLLQINEEANLTLEKEHDTPFKTAQINYIARGRQHKISTLTIAQRWRNLDENVLNNTDFIIFSASMKTEEVVQLLLEYAPEYAQSREYRSNVRSFLTQARKLGPYAKVYIHRKRQERIAFNPYSPRSYVNEESA